MYIKVVQQTIDTKIYHFDFDVGNFNKRSRSGIVQLWSSSPGSSRSILLLMTHLWGLEDVMGSQLKNPTARSICIAMILFLVSLTFSGRTYCEGYDPEGFISLDCGSPEEDYVDPQTNLTWRGDGSYIKLGESGVTRPYIPDIPRRLKHFIYFPIWRRKYCYEFPLTRNTTTFLLRATFLHTNSTGQQDPRTRFHIFVNNTVWLTVQYRIDEDTVDNNFLTYFAEVREGIFLNTGAYVVNVCLVRDLGNPFISTLELRELDYDGILYSENLMDERGQSYFLTNTLRWNMAPPSTARDTNDTAELTPIPIRYPDDGSDRIWELFDNHTPPFREPPSPISLSQVNFSVLQVNLSLLNNLPQKVMEYGLSPAEDGDGTIRFWLPDSVLRPSSSLSFILYFYSNQSTENSPVPLRVTLDQQFWKSWNSTSKLTAESLYRKTPLYVDPFSGLIEIKNLPNIPLHLLALEVYEGSQFTTRLTAPSSVYVVNFIKENFNLSDWQGDPCLPEPHDWLECSFGSPSGGAESYITSLTLSQLSITNTSRIMEFDFYHNLFLGQLSITHSTLSDAIMSNFIVLLINQGMHLLNLSYNHITANTLWGENLIYFLRQDILDLSHNEISRAPLEIELMTHGDPYLLYEGPYLREVDISNNGMRGELPLNYFLRLSGVSFLNADHNALGRLNLTIWCQKLQQLFQNSSIAEKTADPIFHQLFSLVNNNISDIVISLEDFESTINISLLIQYFNTFSSGILLGSNPYCEDAKLLFHRYLCRSSTTDRSYEIFPKSKSKARIYVGVFGGLGLLLLLIMGVLAYLRILYLQEQLREAETFQKAMAEKDVNLRFYQYADLQRATQNFDKNNQLGRGGFGDVYKGVLKEDGKDKTIAIKILANKQKEGQVLMEDSRDFLHDFMNEVEPLRKIKHKNLVELLGWSLKRKTRILIFEFVERGDITGILWGSKSRDEGILGWDERLKICLGVAKGLAYLHGGLEDCIIHRDIKAANVLLDRNLNPKIADFGLAKFIHEGETQAQYTKQLGTKEYAAPEYVSSKILTEKYDVYSFGVLLLEIISGRKCEDSNQDDMDRWFLKSWLIELQKRDSLLELLQPELKEKCPLRLEDVKEVINIAIWCLKDDYTQRPTMSTVQNRLENIMTKDARSHNLLNSEMNTLSAEEIVPFDIESGSSESSSLNKTKGILSPSLKRFLSKRQKSLTDVSEKVALVPKVEGEPSERLNTEWSGSNISKTGNSFKLAT